MKNRLLAGLMVCSILPAATPSTEIPPTSNIKIDQAGYATGGRKVAFLVMPGSAFKGRYSICRAGDSKVVFEGSWTAPAFDADSGDQVQTADFSAFDASGEYYIDVPSLGRSWTFKIAPDVYSRAYYLSARSFYGQRCGTEVDLGSEFSGLRHGVCHTVGAYDASSGKAGPHASEKGWHDAGDYGRYMVNSGIATATLLWAVELWGTGSMRTVSLHIPESGNGSPDLLNEARWNVDWMLTMQDTDGGVWHKQTSSHFCNFVAADKDELPSLVIGAGKEPFKTSCATADFAAVAAIAARVFAPYDHAYSEKCLFAARKAWQWLESHDEITFHNPPGITSGEYGDEHCADEKLWAAAELARTTKETAFDDYFGQHYSEFLDRISSDEPPAWSNMAPFALWTYALAKGNNQAAINAIQARSIEAANTISGRAETQPYRTTMIRKNYIWGSNGVAANYGLQLLIANRLHPDPRYVAAAAENVHYLLGRNPFSLCYVTALGSHAVQHIHHRPSVADKRAWPGLLSGGPNAGRQDPEMKRLVAADTPPERAFLDSDGSYASNEVAINWNAPLVFVLAGLLPQ